MFKENRTFWLCLLGIVVLFFLIYSVLRAGFSGSSLAFSGFPFNLLDPNAQIYQPAKVNLDITKDYEATISTNKGDFTIDLYEKNAPNTVTNFISLANNGYYENTSFYRLIPDLLIQGGSSLTKNSNPNDDIFGGPGYTILDEINWDSLDYSDSLKNQLRQEGYNSTTKIPSYDLTHYSVAMASNGPNTAGGQFFIIIAQNNDSRLNSLKGRHTVFGRVSGGYRVFDEISQIKVKDQDTSVPRPVSEVIINKITIKSK